VQLAGLELHDADLAGCYMPSADLSGASFHRVRLQNSNLMWVNFRDAHLVDVDLSGCLLERSCFQDAYLYDANLAGAELSNYSNLSQSAMHRVILTGTNLEDADLSHCQFTEMDFSGVNLAVTNLTGADLW
jgi:uncharacterized protein YjbI with pentapeptide repeats